MTRKLKVTMSVMFGGLCEVTMPTKEEMLAGVSPEVGLYPNSFTASVSKPTVIASTADTLSSEEEQLAMQLAYNTLAVHMAKLVAEATQGVLDEYGQAAVSSDSFPVPSGGASA